MNEFISLTASGYDWKCPNCEHQNYSKSVGQQVVCQNCRSAFCVDRVAHKIGTTPGMVTATAAGYKFQCPECRDSSYIGAVTKEIQCPTCKAKLSVQWLEHNIASVTPVPQSDPVETTGRLTGISEKPIVPEPAAEAKPVEVQATPIPVLAESGQLTLI